MTLLEWPAEFLLSFSLFFELWMLKKKHIYTKMSYKGMVCVAEFLQEVILISETISYKVTWRKRRQESQEEPISE